MDFVTMAENQTGKRLEVIFIATMLRELVFEFSPTLLTDSQGCIAVAHDPNYRPSSCAYCCKSLSAKWRC